MTQKLKNGMHECAQKGITLIALIITIIVMLVLVAVTISMAINGGLFEKAGKAVGETQNAINAEQELANGRIKIGGVWYDSIDDFLNGRPSQNQGEGAGTTPYLPNSNFSYVEGTSLDNGLVIRDNVGNEYVWIEVPNDGTGPNYSSVKSSSDYDNIEKALQNYASKYRDSNYVDKWYDGRGNSAPGDSSSSSTSTSTSTSGSTISMLSPSNANLGTLALSNDSFSVVKLADSSTSTSTSTSDSSSNSSSTSTSTSGSSSTGGAGLDDTSGCGLTYTQYTTLKHQMLTSIYENGGFYIGRYEAGTSTPRTEHSDITTSTTIKALSQQNQYPLNRIYCSEAQILASKVAKDAGLEDYTTSLMFGIQWDLVLTYLEKKGTTYEELAGGDEAGSKNWGNYYNNLWTISNTSAKYSTDNSTWTNGAYGTKSSNSGILLSTGASDTFSKQGIYDFAGNLCEWTLELCTSSRRDGPCTFRGGDGEGVAYWCVYASSRMEYGTQLTYYDVAGFRVALY